MPSLRALLRRVTAAFRPADAAGWLAGAGQAAGPALEAGRMGIWEWDIVGGRVYWSPSLEALHGLAAGAFAGTFEAFQADVHPDDRERVMTAIAGSLEGAAEHHLEYRIVRPDGAVRWVEARGRRLTDAAGRPVRMVGICLDVTDRKTVERELDERRREAEVAAELIRSISASLDLETVLQRVCLAARELCASDTAAIALPEDDRGEVMVVRARVAPGAPAQLVRRIERGRGVGGRVLETGRPFRTDDYRGDPRFGKEYLELASQAGTVAALVVPIRIDETIGGLLYVTNRATRPFSDRDERVLLGLADHAAVAIRNARLLASRQHALAEAERANRAKDEFLATLSHELRTPLTAMLGWVRMLRAGRLGSEQAATALEVIERNTRLQAQLINDLLDVSRIVSGKLQLDRRPLELVSVIEDALASIKREADAKGLVVEASINPSAGPVLGDRVRLHQVVVNLLSNALKFTPAGGRIHVTLQRDGDSALLQVSDSGVGIEPALLSQIFSRFLQADSSSSRQHGGLGLGLAIVRHLVELHEGVVRADSGGPGTGATFTVELPTLPVGGEAVAAVAAAPVDPERGLPRLAGVRVLVVDDHADARELIVAVLRQCGADVLAAGSAAAGLQALEEARVDVLVSDVAMPGADGYALLREVRERERRLGASRLPAIALTAYAGPGDRARALEAGFQAHVAKPVAPDELAEVVARFARPGPGTPGAA